MGCTRVPIEQQIYDELALHIQAASQAQQQAASHWDKLIEGEDMSCQVGLPTLADFTLTQSEADAYPPALLVRDHLNRSIAFLNQSVTVWNQICTHTENLVIPEDANQGYLAIQNAKIELDLAQASYAAWNP